jgi:hypothetical protein
MAEECYLLGLRTFGMVVEMLDEHVDEILRLFGEMFAKAGVDPSIARPAAETLVAMFGEFLATFCFSRTAAAVGHERLEQTYDTLRTAHPTPAVRLIDIVVRLDNLGFPSKEITSLYEEMHHLPFTQNLLRRFVADHLSLHPPSNYRLRQQMCQLLKLPTKGRALPR